MSSVAYQKFSNEAIFHEFDMYMEIFFILKYLRTKNASALNMKLGFICFLKMEKPSSIGVGVGMLN